MNQLIGELKLFTIDNKQINLRKDALIYKTILDEPFYHNSGNLNLYGDSSSFYELKNINYIYLVSNENFNILINDKVVLNTQQFNYVNRYRNINIAIQCKPLTKQVVEFCYGNLELGDESEGLQLINQKPACAAKWDRVLKNIVLTIDKDNPDPLIFPNISKICG